MGCGQTGFVMFAMGFGSFATAASAETMGSERFNMSLDGAYDAASRFNLAAVLQAETNGNARLLHRDAVMAPDLPRPERVKIRVSYQPLEGGPQFEVGTYGSRKGAMKSKLFHVAMDWVF